MIAGAIQDISGLAIRRLAKNKTGTCQTCTYPCENPFPGILAARSTRLWLHFIFRNMATGKDILAETGKVPHRCRRFGVYNRIIKRGACQWQASSKTVESLKSLWDYRGMIILGLSSVSVTIIPRRFLR
jgi:hypothetical protein